MWYTIYIIINIVRWRTNYWTKKPSSLRLEESLYLYYTYIILYFELRWEKSRIKLGWFTLFFIFLSGIRYILSLNIVWLRIDYWIKKMSLLKHQLPWLYLFCGFKETHLKDLLCKCLWLRKTRYVNFEHMWCLAFSYILYSGLEWCKLVI